MKKVLVTGVAKGIGRAIAKRFLEEGYALYGTFYQSERMARELEKEYGREYVHLFGPYDLTDISECFALLDELKKYQYNSLICNAGVFEDGDDFNNFDINRFNRTMNCNFYQSLILSTGLKNNICAGGSIVLMSSNDAYPGAFKSISYTVSKASLISLTKCLCMNYGEKRIRVNSVAPGAIDTDMNTPEQAEIAPFFTPCNRMGVPVDVAKVVYFLASDESSFVNGANITIDGGYCNTSVLLKAEADSEFSENIRQFISNRQNDI